MCEQLLTDARSLCRHRSIGLPLTEKCLSRGAQPMWHDEQSGALAAPCCYLLSGDE